MMDRMMDGAGGMMWGMGLFGLLVIVVLLLAAAALVKYLFFGRRRNERPPADRSRPAERRQNDNGP